MVLLAPVLTCHLSPAPSARPAAGGGQLQLGGGRARAREVEAAVQRAAGGDRQEDQAGAWRV